MDDLQATTPYLDALHGHARDNPARYNVPAHKGGRVAGERLLAALGAEAFRMDIPPIIRGIDAGGEPTPFEQSQRLAAHAWGARRTWFLANGASQGNHAVCLALRQMGPAVVVQRNAHSSMFDALIMTGLRPAYAYPEIDEKLGIAHCVSPAELDRAITATPAATAAIVVSPTYYGFSGDVEALADVAHAHGLPLVVDEAWGAHFTFSDRLPKSALASGADLVTSSTHKLLGSLTQSAMLHLGISNRIEESVVDRAVSLVESTSPNALLAGSLDGARQHAMTAGRALISVTIDELVHVREQLAAIPGVCPLDDALIGTFAIAGFDPFRISLDITATGHRGQALNSSLNDQGVFIELIQDRVLVAIAGMGETSKDFSRLIDALQSAVESSDVSAPAGDQVMLPPTGAMALSPREAFFAEAEIVAIDQAADRIAAEGVAVYPPGVPNLLPGERITRANLDYIRDARSKGNTIRGASDRTLATLRVVRETNGEGNASRNP